MGAKKKASPLLYMNCVTTVKTVVKPTTMLLLSEDTPVRGLKTQLESILLKEEHRSRSCHRNYVGLLKIDVTSLPPWVIKTHP